MVPANPHGSGVRYERTKLYPSAINPEMNHGNQRELGGSRAGLGDRLSHWLASFGLLGAVILALLVMIILGIIKFR